MSFTMGRRGAPYALLAPFLVVFLLVGVFPLGRALYWAVHSAREGSPVFVGLAQFSRLAADRIFWFSFANTLAFTVAYVVLLIPLATGLAVLMDRPGVVGKRFMRLLLFSTYLVGPVYVATIVTLFLARDRGPLSPFLPHGFDALSEPLLAMPIILAASLWGGVGYAFVYIIAALQNVDAELLDAARVDGATSWQRLRNVTLPQIAPTLAFVALVSGVGALQLLELPFILFQGAGPGNAALTLGMYLFSTAFEQGDLGYASAIGWALAMAVSLLGAFLVRAVSAGRSP